MADFMAPDIAAAISSAEPLLAIRSVLQRRIDAGDTRAQLVEELTTAMLRCRAAGDERSDDRIADGLDILTGFVSPHLQLSFPNE